MKLPAGLSALPRFLVALGGGLQCTLMPFQRCRHPRGLFSRPALERGQLDLRLLEPGLGLHHGLLAHLEPPLLLTTAVMYHGSSFAAWQDSAFDNRPPGGLATFS